MESIRRPFFALFWRHFLVLPHSKEEGLGRKRERLGLKSFLEGVNGQKKRRERKGRILSPTREMEERLWNNFSEMAP